MFQMWKAHEGRGEGRFDSSHAMSTQLAKPLQGLWAGNHSMDGEQMANVSCRVRGIKRKFSAGVGEKPEDHGRKRQKGPEVSEPGAAGCGRGHRAIQLPSPFPQPRDSYSNRQIALLGCFIPTSYPGRDQHNHIPIKQPNRSSLGSFTSFLLTNYPISLQAVIRDSKTSLEQQSLAPLGCPSIDVSSGGNGKMMRSKSKEAVQGKPANKHAGGKQCCKSNGHDG